MCEGRAVRPADQFHHHIDANARGKGRSRRPPMRIGTDRRRDRACDRAPISRRSRSRDPRGARSISRLVSISLITPRAHRAQARQGRHAMPSAIINPPDQPYAGSRWHDGEARGATLTPRPYRAQSKDTRRSLDFARHDRGSCRIASMAAHLAAIDRAAEQRAAAGAEQRAERAAAEQRCRPGRRRSRRSRGRWCHRCDGNNSARHAAAIDLRRCGQAADALLPRSAR